MPSISQPPAPPPSRAALLLALLTGCVAIFVGCQSGPEKSPDSLITEKQQLHLAAASARLDAPGFAFPWSGLEAYLAQQPGAQILVVGYGSLMSRESAAETIERAEEQDFAPVLAAGAKRVFNYVIPPKVLAELNTPRDSRERAASNVVVTGKADDVINGRLIAVKARDLAGMREREYGYHLRPVACVRWDDKTAEPFIAYVLVAEDPVVNGRRVIDNQLLPNPFYVEICLDGARSVSPQFERLYLKSSYLADGKTTLRHWMDARKR